MNQRITDVKQKFGILPDSGLPNPPRHNDRHIIIIFRMTPRGNRLRDLLAQFFRRRPGGMLLHARLKPLIAE